MNMFKLLILLCLFIQQNNGDNSNVHKTIARAALEQVGITVLYDSKYVRLSYPGGDVPLDRGVCCDVIVRAFRKIGVDLQKEVHEDMTKHFNGYPDYWKLKAPDYNIDHRRVPNLMTYFKRKGKYISIDSNYITGDVVAWRLPSGSYHIGIISENVVTDEQRHYVIHNIGSGTKEEDILFKYKIIGHYRW